MDVSCGVALFKVGQRFAPRVFTCEARLPHHGDRTGLVIRRKGSQGEGVLRPGEVEVRIPAALQPIETVRADKEHHPRIGENRPPVVEVQYDGERRRVRFDDVQRATVSDECFARGLVHPFEEPPMPESLE